MNWKFASTVSAFVCSAVCSCVASHVAARAQNKPVVFTTAPKMVVGHLRSETGDFAVRGHASLTVTAANEHDTLVGTLVYTLPDEARQKIAQLSGKALKDVPSAISVKNVTANFQHGTACPLVKLEVSMKETDVAGTKLLFDRIILDIHETPDQMNQLFCSWTRQINAKRQRHGIIAAINRLINIED